MAWLGIPRKRAREHVEPQQTRAENAALRPAVCFTIAFICFTISKLLSLNEPSGHSWQDLLRWGVPLLYLFLASFSWRQYVRIRRGELVIVPVEQPAPGPESPAVWWVMVSLIGVMTLLTAAFTFVAVMLSVLSWQRQAPAPPGLLIFVSALAVLFWVAVIVFWRRIMAERPNKPEE